MPTCRSIVAPAGLAIGGGCEIVLHADRVQAAAESYIGLVEVGVGLIPAGRWNQRRWWRAPPSRCRQDRTDFLPPIQRAFEAIGFAEGLARARRTPSASDTSARRTP